MKTKVTKAGERVGILALDPGRTTGCCIATVTLKGSVKEIFERDPPGVFEINCNDQRVNPIKAEVHGAREIAGEWLEATAEWTIEGIPTTNQFLVYEDFILNRRNVNFDRSGISPARVMSLVMGMLIKYDPQYVPQQPGQAKQRWTSDRLRSSGLWTVGLDHGRDATRHAALWVVGQIA